MSIFEVKHRNMKKLLQTKGVVGVGLGELRDDFGNSVPCIRIYVLQLTEKLLKTLQSSEFDFEGYLTDIMEVGEPQLQSMIRH